MNTAIVALLVMVIAVMGVYIAVSNLQQYTLEPGGSYAGKVACSPDKLTAGVGQTVRFAAAGLPTGATPHWSSDDGRGQASAGTFSVIYSSPGTKTVRLFFLAEKQWNLITCSVRVR